MNDRLGSASMTLPPLVVSGRLDRVRAGAEPDHILYITNPADVTWLSGFRGSNGQMLVGPDSAVLLTDSRYELQAAHQLEAAGADGIAVLALGPGEGPLAAIERIGRHPMAADANHLTVAGWRSLADDWPEPVVDLDANPVAVARRRKDQAELARLQLAAAIADEALKRTLPLLDQKVTEAVFAANFEFTVRLLGADGPAFDTIVASGPNSALPHATPTNRVIEPGELVVIDCGARLDGYGSDMTRTVVSGGHAAPWQAEQYAAVLAAQQAGVATVRAGVAGRRIDEVCRQVLAEEGFGGAYSHGTGHGIGLEIHEYPILSPRATDSLEADWVITVEPGAYVGGRGGVRVEDSCIVTADGAQTITQSPTGLEPWV